MEVVINSITVPEDTKINIDDIKFTEETIAEVLGLQRDDVVIEYNEEK